MKAIVLHGIGDLRCAEQEMPVCGADEVLVQVKECGICGSDIPRVFVKGTYHFPTVIGHEFAGKVVRDAEGALTGRRVAVFPLLPCFECEACKAGRYTACLHYDYYGSRRNGGMAEYIAVKRWNLIPLPDGVSYAEGAMCEPVSVARHAVAQLQVRAGDRVLIAGSGPIGLIAGQWARAAGAEAVYYFDIDPQKITFAEKQGFSAYTPGCRINAVIEGTGHSGALQQCLEAAEPRGRVVLMGNPAKEITLSQNAYWLILRKELQLTGTWNSEYRRDWEESLRAMAEGRIRVDALITHRFPPERSVEAFQMIRNRAVFHQKVLIEMNGEEQTNEK